MGAEVRREGLVEQHVILPGRVVEGMNRMIEETTEKRYRYDDHAQLRKQPDHFIATYNFGRWLRTLNRLMPYEFSCEPVDNGT